MFINVFSFLLDIFARANRRAEAAAAAPVDREAVEDLPSAESAEDSVSSASGMPGDSTAGTAGDLPPPSAANPTIRNGIIVNPSNQIHINIGSSGDLPRQATESPPPPPPNSPVGVHIPRMPTTWRPPVPAELEPLMPALANGSGLNSSVRAVHDLVRGGEITADDIRIIGGAARDTRHHRSNLAQGMLVALALVFAALLFSLGWGLRPDGFIRYVLISYCLAVLLHFV